MKKFFALLFTAIMIMAIAIPSFAADDGIITINGVSEDSVYEIYKVLDLESYNPETGAYSYKVNADWAELFATEDALTYVAIDDAGYVTWVAGDNDDTVAVFAKIALAYAKDNGIDPVKSSTVEGDMAISTNYQDKLTGTFSGLALGYYLVDSNVGALCGLTTTNPTASINAKNGVPTVDKQVQEDSTEQWGSNNSADIGQTVNFRVTVNVHAGAENYVIHDKMSDGLTFDANSVIATLNGEAVSADDFTVVKPGECENEEGCTFEVRFTKAFCDKLETNDKLIVYYSAMLNRNAVINGDGNPNEAWLEYGEDHFTIHDTTNTMTDSVLPETGGTETVKNATKSPDTQDDQDTTEKETKSNINVIIIIVSTTIIIGLLVAILVIVNKKRAK